jgi:hypothetical protein
VIVYENELSAFLRTVSVDRNDRSPNDAVIVASVSLGTFVVPIRNSAVTEPAGTITKLGTVAAGLSLTNPIDVYVGYRGAGIFSVTVPVVFVPPFTAGNATVILTNAMLEDVGCVGDDPPNSSPACRPHADMMMSATTQMIRPVTTAPILGLWQRNAPQGPRLTLATGQNDTFRRPAQHQPGHVKGLNPGGDEPSSASVDQLRGNRTATYS